MALKPNRGVPMLLSILATGLCVLASLLFLASFLISGGFAGNVPGGSNAMGLVIPLFASVIAALMLLLAAGLAASNGRFEWLGARGGWLAAVVALGVGVAAIGVLIAWMERSGSWVAPVGIFVGGFAPIAACGLLLASLWLSTAQLTSLGARWIGAVLALAAVAGLVLALMGLASWLRLANENAERARATAEASEAESARRQALTPVERLREDYAQMSADAPLWVFVAGLPDVTDAAERDFTIARALQVPDLDAQLQGTLGGDHPRYRHGALDMIIHAPTSALKPEWVPILVQAIDVSARQIAERPEWLVPDDFSNPDPAAHVRAMIAAADRLGGGADLDAALARLQAAVAASPAGAQRDAVLAVFSVPR